MKLNKDGIVELEFSEIEKEYQNLIEHLDASGVCIVSKDGDRQFYLVHPEVFEEMELRLSLYQKAFEELNEFEEIDDTDDHHHS